VWRGCWLALKMADSGFVSREQCGRPDSGMVEIKSKSLFLRE
jgi:hypothetical protein